MYQYIVIDIAVVVHVYVCLYNRYLDHPKTRRDNSAWPPQYSPNRKINLLSTYIKSKYFEGYRPYIYLPPCRSALTLSYSIKYGYVSLHFVHKKLFLFTLHVPRPLNTFLKELKLKRSKPYISHFSFCEVQLLMEEEQSTTSDIYTWGEYVTIRSAEYSDTGWPKHPIWTKNINSSYILQNI